MKPEIIRLHLLSPLFYFADKSGTFDFKQEDGEKLFCFEVEKAQAARFEPDKNCFPGSLVFSGKAAGKGVQGEPGMEFKRGDYIFTQVQEILNLDDIVDLAIEVQNEGLWQRLQIGPCFYVRFLLEEDRGVTQIWRPYSIEFTI